MCDTNKGLMLNVLYYYTSIKFSIIGPVVFIFYLEMIHRVAQRVKALYHKPSAFSGSFLISLPLASYRSLLFISEKVGEKAQKILIAPKIIYGPVTLQSQ